MVNWVHLTLIFLVFWMPLLIFPSSAKVEHSFDHKAFLFPGKALNIIEATILFRAFCVSKKLIFEPEDISIIG